MPPATDSTSGAAEPAPLPYPDCVPVLTDGVVTLRAHEDPDAARVVEQCNDPESMRWLPLPRPYGLEQAEGFLAGGREAWEQADGRREWAILADGRYAGSIAVFDRSAQRAELGFHLHPDLRGSGVMARAVRLVLGWAVGEGIEQVLWGAAVGNWASRRVAWACGFGVPVLLEAGSLDHAGLPHDAWRALWRAAEPMRPAYPWLDVPQLSDTRVRLRAFTEADEESLPAQQDPVAARFMAPVVPVPDGYAAWLTSRRELAASGKGVAWAIERVDTGRLAGGIQLALPGPDGVGRVALVGYWLLQSHRGEGLAEAALDLVVDHALAPTGTGGFGVDGLRARTDIENLALIRTLLAAGFRQSGVERAAYRRPDGTTTDGWVFDLLATDDRAAQRIRPLAGPVFETERVRLRPWRDDDTPDPTDGPDAAALRFMPAGAQPGAAEFPAWLARRRRLAVLGRSVDWCLADQETDRPLGQVTLFERGDAPVDFQAELGYWVFPSARGCGLLAEALPPVLDHAFRSRAEGGLGLTRVHAGTDLDNEASRAVLRRLGMREWGRDRQAWRRQDGSLADGSFWELLDTDPRAGH